MATVEPHEKNIQHQLVTFFKAIFIKQRVSPIANVLWKKKVLIQCVSKVIFPNQSTSEPE